jgi:conjugal transfer pilus assembly protein TraB
MAKFNINIKERYKQYKNLISIIGIVAIFFFAIIVLFSQGSSAPQKSSKELSVFDGVIDDTFSDSDADSAISSQEIELSDLKKEIGLLKEKIKETNTQKPVQLEDFEKKLTEKIKAQLQKPSEDKAGIEKAQLASLSDNGDLALGGFMGDRGYKSHKINSSQALHTVSFHYDLDKSQSGRYKKNENNYVPSGTFAKAVILGGADADASVNGERKNNGVMLFKIVSDGVLPNNKHSHLKGCFITASTYGDISSERAYVILDKISCAQTGRPMIDKSVTGWAFFAGKVGIKGKATMRDGKIVAWAGVSGALSGISQAAQAAQSIQNITPIGATSILPSDRVLGFAGLGGASKAAAELSSYYIKRAEQYHPIIQVGAGNLVNIVFKDGFSLMPDEGENDESFEHAKAKRQDMISKEPAIPASLLKEITQKDVNYELGSQINKGAQS